jgi:hypothetical protein
MRGEIRFLCEIINNNMLLHLHSSSLNSHFPVTILEKLTVASPRNCSVSLSPWEKWINFDNL